MKIFLGLVVFSISILLSATSFAESTEELLIKRYPEIFKKNKNTLTITFDNEKFKIFESTGEVSEGMVTYGLLNYIGSQNIVVIEKVEYENIAYQLISLKDGKETDLIGAPVWNSEENKFVSVGSGAYQPAYCVDGDCKLLARVEGNYIRASWAKENNLVLTKETQTSCTFKNKKMICKK